MAYNELPKKKKSTLLLSKESYSLNLIMMAYNEPPKKKKSTLLVRNESYGWIW